MPLAFNASYIKCAIKHFNPIIAQNSGNLYQLHEKPCIGITSDEFFPQGSVFHNYYTNFEVYMNFEKLEYCPWYINFRFGRHETSGVYLVCLSENLVRF